MKKLPLYTKIVKMVAEESYCNRRKVGALLISPDGENIISYGYNGTIKGFDNVCELEDGTTNNEIVLHAEANAIMKACRDGRSTEGCSLIITLSPCVSCAKLILQSGITSIYYLEEYEDTSGVKLLEKSGWSGHHWVDEYGQGVTNYAKFNNKIWNLN